MSRARFIFLDMDGVLNSHSFLMRHRRQSDGELYSIYDDDLNWEDMIDPACVARLNRIVSETGAKVVLSSSWRHAHTFETVDGFLCARGFASHLIDATPTINEKGMCRGDEIKLWLDTNAPGARFTILDDVAQMGSLTPWLINTNLLVGLTDEDATRAIEMLMSENDVVSVPSGSCGKNDCVVCSDPRIQRITALAVQSGQQRR